MSIDAILSASLLVICALLLIVNFTDIKKTHKNNG